MGQDYSYTQPSSSAESLDMTSLLEAECELYKDEDDSRILHQVYGDEADDGMPSTCYCGSDAVVATSYTRKDPGRLYLTCENVNDGDCHIWKWWDVAVTEELRDVQTQLRLVKEQAFECDQKLMKLQKVVCELSKKNAVLRNGFMLCCLCNGRCTTLGWFGGDVSVWKSFEELNQSPFRVCIIKYPNRGMADRFMQNAIVSEGQRKQKNCHQECKKSCHVFQTERKVCILVTPASKTTFLPEELCIGFGICVKRYPFEAVQIIKPNLGRLDNPQNWQKYLTHIRGSELESYLTRVVEENLKICAGLGLDRRAKEVFGGELQWFAIAIGFIEKAETYMLDDSRLLKCGEVTTMSDLPDDLAEEILSRVPLTSLSAVRSTCRKWNDLSKNQVFGKSASTGRKQFLGFMLKDYKVCSMKFDLQGIGNEGDFVDPSIKEVSILDQVETTQVFHCGGLLLCVTKDRSRLLVWNPYLGQTRWIQPRNTFRSEDRYAVGYDKNRNYKILRVFGKYDTKGEFGSADKYLILGNFVSLSCVREEQLAVLHQSSVIDHTLEIWVSSNIDLGAVSWSKFLRTTSFCRVDFQAGSFFIDEEKKVAVVVDLDNGGQARTETHYNQRANIIGEDEYYKPVNVGEALDHGKLNKFGFLISDLCRPLVCSYVPSTAQLQLQP
ncbi:hypothetical protein Bca52824_085820 [Brassica carinata]|uniref:F-box domain-containing protein n=1 Tax=Brassica carinata TaxID=52824 RepID=A0A8X7P901_BRACI|nr:hypothetical protein Bca52824_085820 [Brassica carinata]